MTEDSPLIKTSGGESSSLKNYRLVPHCLLQHDMAAMLFVMRSQQWLKTISDSPKGSLYSAEYFAWDRFFWPCANTTSFQAESVVMAIMISESIEKLGLNLLSHPSSE